MANILIFYGDFTRAGVATAPSSPPTVAVYRVNRSTGAETVAVAAATATTASALAGRYFYRLTTGDLQTYDYHARFTTSDTTVDAADVPALWVRWSEAVATDAGGVVTADVTTIKAQAVTCAAPVTVLASVGTAAASTAQTGDNFARLGAPAGASLAADIQTRSTYAGGAVASVTGAVGSVTAPVTAGTVTDKAGYALAAAGLDAVAVDSMNIRQGVNQILAACGGVLSGAGSGSITIKGAGTATTRVTATSDSSGNRSAVTHSPPA